MNTYNTHSAFKVNENVHFPVFILQSILMWQQCTKPTVIAQCTKMCIVLYVFLVSIDAYTNFQTNNKTDLNVFYRNILEHLTILPCGLPHVTSAVGLWSSRCAKGRLCFHCCIYIWVTWANRFTEVNYCNICHTLMLPKRLCANCHCLHLTDFTIH